MIDGILRVSLVNPGRQFFALEISSAPKLRPVRVSPRSVSTVFMKELSLLSLVPMTPSEISPMIFSMDLQQLPKCWILQIPCTHLQQKSSTLLSSVSPLRLQPWPALPLHSSDNPIQLLADENKSLTVQPHQRTL
jgi:hypothetical protein